MTDQQPPPTLEDRLSRLGLNGPLPRWVLAHRQVPARATRPAVRPLRAALLWLLSAPLPLAAMIALAAGRIDGFVGDGLAWGLVALAALLTQASSRRAALEQRRRYGRRWRLPLRNVAAVLLGLGTGVAAVLGIGYPLSVGVGFGIVSVLGYHLVYGLQSMRVGQRLSAQDKETRVVVEALAEAEDRLLSIERAAQAIGNPELGQRLARIADLGRGILSQIAERPSDLRRARRFLTVFLEGAEQVSDGYARTHRHADSAELEQRFRTVLITIEDQFIRQRERLREADVFDLDIQIEVLKKQLEQEGIR